MERQERLLNQQYLETRIRELKEIRRKEITFEIQESDRAFSKTLYINFYSPSNNGKWFKNATLRISDHELNECPFNQFIIDPSACLTKKKKAELMRNLELAIKKAKSRSFYKEMEKLTKRKISDEQNSNI